MASNCHVTDPVSGVSLHVIASVRHSKMACYGIPFTFLQLLAVLSVLLRNSHAVQYKTGPFLLDYSTGQIPLLQITHDFRDVWHSPTDPKQSSFVAGAEVDYRVSQNGGVFNIKSSVVQKCTESKILSLQTLPVQPYPIVLLQGTLCSTARFNLSFQAVDQKDPQGRLYSHLHFTLTLLDTSVYNQVWLVYGADKDEGFYGFGLQYSKVNVKGKRLPVFTTEQGVGRGLEPVTAILDLAAPGTGGTWYTTYSHVAHYITNKGRSLMLESREYTVFDLTAETTVTIEINSTQMVGRILTGTSPLVLVTSYTAYAGRLPPLPSWTNKGAVLGLEGGTKIVMDTVAKIRASQGSLDDVAAVWLQDWTGQRRFNNSGHDIARVGLWWNWELDSTHYPDWSGMVSNLTSEGVRVLVYINCLVTDVSKRGTPYRRNLYKEGLEKGYLVNLTNGEIWTGYTEGAMVDLSNPQAYSWYMSIIQEEMLALNVSGWMADFGESLPLDSALYSGENPSAVHSKYPDMWAELNQKAVWSYRQGTLQHSQWNASDIVFFMRSASNLSPRFSSLFWLGDQLVTWDHFDGLQTAITGMLSGGFSGFSLIHSDTGGYTTIDVSLLKYVRSKRLFMRWAELSSLTPFFRTHPGSLPEANWQFNSDKETLEHFFKMVKVFKAWAFYRESLMRDAQQNGWPVVRHLLLEFPNNTAVTREDLSKQYMLGSQMLVAPQYSSSESAFYVRVFLPSGLDWVHLWTNVTYRGGDSWVQVPAPLGQPCVLYRKGSPVGKQFQENVMNM